MLASIPSASLLGASGIPVRVEVHVGKGLPGFRIVGHARRGVPGVARPGPGGGA